MFNKLKAIIIIIMLFALLYLYAFAGYRVVDCQNNENLTFAAPANKWVKINCLEGSHAIAAANSYKWTKSDNEVYLDAREYLENITKNKYSEDKNTVVSKGVFLKVYSNKLLPYQVDNLNKDLAKEIDAKENYKEVYHLRVFSSFRFPYDLFVYLNNSKPKYIYACIDYCHVYPPEVIKVGELN